MLPIFSEYTYKVRYVLSRQYKVIILTLIACFSWSMASAGEPNLTPVNLSGATVVTPAQALQMLTGEGVILLDTRNPLNYGRGYIPGAKLSPFNGHSENTVTFDSSAHHWNPQDYGADIHSTIIIYSHGDTGWKSYKAAVLSVAAGYTKVFWMRDGFSAWKDANYPVEH
ncbi:MAG: rhodanese-like domain-containing protein [Motiliproteus sp.]